MKRTTLYPTLLILFLVAAHRPAVAQEPPPQPGPGRPAGPDRSFLLGQQIRAIDMKASILIDQGKHDLAAEELKRVLTIDAPRDTPVFEAKAHALGRLAITYTNLGRKKEALETMQKLLAEVPPGSVAEMTAYLDAGTVYKQCGMPEEALKAFDKAIELSEKLAKTAPRGPAGRPMGPPHGGPAPGGRPQQPPPPNQ